MTPAPGSFDGSTEPSPAAADQAQLRRLAASQEEPGFELRGTDWGDEELSFAVQPNAPAKARRKFGARGAVFARVWLVVSPRDRSAPMPN
jgi:hypothetical protein